MNPAESESVTTLAPSCMHFSAAYCATLPEPETDDAQPVEVLPARLEHLLREVDAPEPGRLGTDQAAAPVHALAR